MLSIAFGVVCVRWGGAAGVEWAVCGFGVSLLSKLRHSLSIALLALFSCFFSLSFVCLSVCAVVCLFTCCLMANKDIYINIIIIIIIGLLITILLFTGWPGTSFCVMWWCLLLYPNSEQCQHPGLERGIL